MSEMQTIWAEALGMERGTSKVQTGREHLERTDYIIAKQKQEAEKTRIAKEQAEAELKAVKGELRTEKLKNSTAEVGTTILDGIGSRIGTSKVKRQQQQIDDLTQKNERLHSEIRRLNKTIDRERREHEQTAKRLQGEIDRIYGWFPDTPQLIRRGEYCREIGFTDKMACDLVNMLPVHFSGKLYSSEHSQHFENEHSEAGSCGMKRPWWVSTGHRLDTHFAMVSAKGGRIFGALRNRDQRPRTGSGNVDEIE